eukprot:6488417-Amphidinium_carterae.1
MNEKVFVLFCVLGRNPLEALLWVRDGSLSCRSYLSPSCYRLNTYNLDQPSPVSKLNPHELQNNSQCVVQDRLKVILEVQNEQAMHRMHKSANGTKRQQMKHGLGIRLSIYSHGGGCSVHPSILQKIEVV